jgi:CubicO group peptidase (beta-lactamase class C family)
MVVILLSVVVFPACVSVYAQADRVEIFLRSEMAERRIPGLQVAVVQRGKIVLLRSLGTANLQYSVPVTNRSVFSINSCTKAFTGVAVMQLVEEGTVDLAAPVSQYLPGLPADWRPVTLRQLLTHVSGLPDILRILNPSLAEPDGAEKEASAWKKIYTMSMEFVPGEQFSYNQTNYALLGKIIDKFSGKPFAQVFRERQFQVAGMPNTDFGDSRDVIPHKAQSYRYSGNLDEERLTNIYEEFSPFRRTASGLNSTAEDLARWILALQQGRLLKTKNALKTLWTAGHYKNGSPTQWALGWVTKPRVKHPAVMATGGGRSAFFIYPQDDLAIVVLTNLAGASPEEFIDELAGYYQPEIPASDPITVLKTRLQERGFERAVEIFTEEKKKDALFLPSETDLNDWAYRMLSRGQIKEALELFQLNVYLYPQSWNVYDSCGEALFKNGRKEEAIRMYRKSIELNPRNQGGKRMLEQLLK